MALRLRSGRIFLASFLRRCFFIQLFLPSVSSCLRSAPLWTWQEEEEEEEGGKPHGRPHGGRGGGLGAHWKQSQRGRGRRGFPAEQKVRRGSEWPS